MTFMRERASCFTMSALPDIEWTPLEWGAAFQRQTRHGLRSPGATSKRAKLVRYTGRRSQGALRTAATGTSDVRV